MTYMRDENIDSELEEYSSSNIPVLDHPKGKPKRSKTNYTICKKSGMIKLKS